jgi:hypothetical protein
MNEVKRTMKNNELKIGKIQNECMREIKKNERRKRQKEA